MILGEIDTVNIYLNVQLKLGYCCCCCRRASGLLVKCAHHIPHVINTSKDATVPPNELGKPNIAAAAAAAAAAAVATFAEQH